LVFSRDLDRAFDRFRPGAGEKSVIGETCVDKPAGEALGLRDLKEIRRMPEPRGLFVQCRKKMGMAVSERGHGDAGAEIEVSFASRSDEPSPFAPLKGERNPGVSWQKRRNHPFSPITGERSRPRFTGFRRAS
jgi:hypothetical protein